jgi:hypothetical protein
MIIDNDNLDRALTTWHRSRSLETGNEIPDDSHLTETDLVRLAQNGGLAEAAAPELRHLDECPHCFSEWSAWRRAFAISETESTETRDDGFPTDCSYGFLEAAADTGAFLQPRVLESRCGNFRLELLPSREEEGVGMVILNCLDPQRKNEMLCVRDRDGRQFLCGRLENGRLARLCRDLGELDLSIWTVIKRDS